MDAFGKRLRELGWESRTARSRSKRAMPKVERLPVLAKALVESKVELVVASSTPPALAMKVLARADEVIE